MRSVATGSDELRALLALGIMASLAVLFQLPRTANPPQVFRPSPPLYVVRAEIDVEFFILNLFTAYIVLLTVCLALEPFTSLMPLARAFRTLSEFAFIGGAISILAGAVISLIRVIV